MLRLCLRARQRITEYGSSDEIAMKSVLPLVLAAALMAGLSGPLAQAASFTFTPLPLIARGLNNAGQGVGYGVAGETTYGVLYDHGTLTTLFVPGSFETLAFGINNQSQIAGYYANTLTGESSFVYDSDRFTSFKGTDNVDTRAREINDGAQVVGYELNPGVGNRGFLYDAGTYRSFAVPGAANTPLTGINNAGTMVGFYNNIQKTYGFLVDASGDFTLLDVPGSSNTFVYGINNLGQIVGNYIESNVLACCGSRQTLSPSGQFRSSHTVNFPIPQRPVSQIAIESNIENPVPFLVANS